MDTAALIKHVLSEHASGVQTFACPICDFATVKNCFSTLFPTLSRRKISML